MIKSMNIGCFKDVPVLEVPQKTRQICRVFLFRALLQLQPLFYSNKLNDVYILLHHKVHYCSCEGDFYNNIANYCIFITYFTLTNVLV